jgi:hypothetical protein
MKVANQNILNKESKTILAGKVFNEWTELTSRQLRDYEFLGLISDYIPVIPMFGALGSNSMFGGGSFGGIESDPVATALIKQISKDPNTVLAPQETTYALNKLWVNGTAANITIPATINAANMASAGFTEYKGTITENEVTLSNADLSGAVPSGVKAGFNVTNGKEYYKDALGNWKEKVLDGNSQFYFPPARTDNATTNPTTTEAPTSNLGDTCTIELSNKNVLYFRCDTAGVWTLKRTTTSDGNALTYAKKRSDEKEDKPRTAELGSVTYNEKDILRLSTPLGKGLWFKRGATATDWTLEDVLPPVLHQQSASAVWADATAYLADETFSITIPATGSFVDRNKNILTNGKTYNLAYPTAQPASGATFDIAEAAKTYIVAVVEGNWKTVQIYDGGAVVVTPTNWALAIHGTTATANNQLIASWGADNTIDGGVHTGNYYHSQNQTDNVVLEVDLGQDRTITSSVLTWERTDAGYNPTFSLEYFDGASWVAYKASGTASASVTQNTASGGYGQNAVTLASVISRRFRLVQTGGSNYVTIREWELIG